MRDRCFPLEYKIPAISGGTGWSGSPIGFFGDGLTHLENLEGFIRVVQQFTEWRGLFLTPHRLVDRFKGLDSGRQGARLDDAQQSPAEAYTALEE